MRRDFRCVFAGMTEMETGGDNQEDKLIRFYAGDRFHDLWLWWKRAK